VKDLSGEEIRRRARIGGQRIDVVIGGPPCQGFSLIGHRVLDDPRNGLVFHFLRLVSELKPRAFVMENVPGMATGQHTRLLSELIDGFQQAGYVVRTPPKILNAANYGVPQNRRRLFVMGAQRGIPLPNYPKPTTALNPGFPSNGNSELPLDDLPLCPSVAEAISDLPELEDFEALFQTDALRAKLSGGSRYARILRGIESDPQDL
jgi:DNA (cytosine-5)-methyltransferase 1